MANKTVIFRPGDLLDELESRVSDDFREGLVAKRDLGRYYEMITRIDCPLTPDEIDELSKILEKHEIVLNHKMDPFRLWFYIYEKTGDTLLVKKIKRLSPWEIVSLVDHIERKQLEREVLLQ